MEMHQTRNAPKGGQPVAYTVEEVAAMLQISTWSVYRLVKNDALEFVKIGRCIRIPVAALAGFLNQGMSETQTDK